VHFANLQIMNDFDLNNTYDSRFYKKQIKLNKNLLKSDKKTLARQGEKNLLELKGRLLFELRTAQAQIKEIQNNPNYEQ